MRVDNLVVYLHCRLHAPVSPQSKNSYGGKNFLSEQQKSLVPITNPSECDV